MQREPYWDYMARRLREEQQMRDSFHIKLTDQEKQKVSKVFDEVDILKKEVSQLQENLQNSYIKIKELRDQVDYYEKLNGPQLEFTF